ncbi:chromate efflux transporter [Phenylobacterium sp.]|jgi:chromate transporter|uniref:chromate efflux transporter n=1 Tax=Phenylobacterium sp. TaxID=1871053 RepID=UPI002E32900C|nr:chromate efflux transporter [Phenylobacterium sp.]HEX3365629.1 chromate efflux transporter [Phenylobacterium sp.]
MDETPPPSRAGPSQAGEVFRAFLVQGLTAFGGPVAHIGYFRREFVERRGWLNEGAFADLLALAQFLPGPASSQLGMAIGLRRAGYLGLIAAWVGFTLPAGVAMIALAYLAPQLAAGWGDGVLHGLQLAAAAVVLNALVAMARTLAVGPIRAGIAIGAGVGLILSPGPVPQILALIAGGLFGLGLLREPGSTEPDDPATQRVPPAVSAGALAAFVLLLGMLPFLAALLDSPSLGLASVFYRTGALVFGGGHVVLPMLQSEIVGRGWLDPDIFIGGYGAVQALPGPLFSFAGFVGAAQQVAPGGWRGGLVAITAIFLPSLLLVVGVLPFWDRLKTQPAARGALAGVNAVVVGVLAAALWNPVLMTAVRRPSDWALAAGAYVFLAVAKLPPWLVVILFAGAVGLATR